MEFIGKELDRTIEKFGIKATKTYEQTHTERFFMPFQVWEAEEEEIKRLEAQDWEDELGWFRYGGAYIHEGTITEEYVVNGHKMNGYSPLIEIEDGWFQDEFKDLFEYIYESIGATTTNNVTSVITSLAKDNNMKIAELLKKYVG